MWASSCIKIVLRREAPKVDVSFQGTNITGLINPHTDGVVAFTETFKPTLDFIPILLQQYERASFINRPAFLAWATRPRTKSARCKSNNPIAVTTASQTKNTTPCQVKGVTGTWGGLIVSAIIGSVTETIGSAGGM